MIISVASGKGGTGKTTVSASLVSVWETPVVAVDLDVEEPNLHLFLKPEIRQRERVTLEIPVIDESKCTLCRTCVDFCRFKAITIMGDIPMVFDEMCHGCGGCLALCPEDALSSGERDLGDLEQGAGPGFSFLAGRLRIGEAMAPPLMRVVKKRLAPLQEQENADAIIDAPPGVSCPAINAVMDSDVIVLVTEPTPFGFHDFKLAWEAFAPIGKPMGVVINRAGIGDSTVQDFCRDNGLPILAEIPFQRTVAEGYSKGQIIATLNDELRSIFCSIRDKIRTELAVKEALNA